MRVLIIRVATRVSGAEVYNINLIKGFRKFSDINLQYLTNLEYFKNKINEAGGKAEVVKTIKEIGTKKDFLRGFLLSPIVILTYITKIKRLEKEGRFDLICLQSMTEKIFLSPVLKLLSYKIIWIEHGPLFKTSRAEIIKLFYKISSVFVDKIIAVSKDTKDDLISGNVNKNKIIPLYIGIDTYYFSPLSKEDVKNKKKKLNLENNIVIGFVGTVCKEKGIIEFIKIAEEILHKNKKIKFLVIGDGALLEWSKIEVKKEKIENNFVFMGRVDDIKSYLGIIDVLLFPTKHAEGVSISILESMSMGIPVFANDIGGNKEIIENKVNGYLLNFSEYKAEKLADILISIIRDKNELIAIGKNGRNFIKEHFDINNNITNFYSFFKNI